MVSAAIAYLYPFAIPRAVAVTPFQMLVAAALVLDKSDNVLILVIKEPNVVIAVPIVDTITPNTISNGPIAAASNPTTAIVF
ncbi:Uncharacterised protein [Streptococcus pneumoniae]|nr:Uncharacterised protein [Streptococcus pneumoniae]